MLLLNGMASTSTLNQLQETQSKSILPWPSTIINNDSNDDDNTVMVANGSSMGGPPLMLSSWKPLMLSHEATRALAACKSHKEAERRRRKRINGHLATLRTLLPHLLKTDKASVLGEVVRRVRELKKATSDLTSDLGDGDVSNKACLFPGDTDEVKLCRCENDGTILVATLCCEDRPELIVDMTRALRSIKGTKLVRAEMATIGGRTKTVLWVRGVGGGGGGGGGGLSGGGLEGLLKRALKVVVDKPSSSFGMGHGLIGNRMQGLY